LQLSDWHFGSDIAKFVITQQQRQQTTISSSDDYGHSWVMCVDLNRKKCDITLLIIILNTSLQPTIRAQSMALSSKIGDLKADDILQVIPNIDQNLQAKVQSMFH